MRERIPDSEFHIPKFDLSSLVELSFLGRTPVRGVLRSQAQTMNFKRTATLVVVGAVLIAWLAGAATSKRAIPPPIVTPPHTIDARGIELTNEIARLRDRLRPTTQPSQPRRNLFTFKAAARPSVAMPDLPSAQPVIEAPAARIAEPPLKLAGIAEDTGPEGPDRTAIISGQGQLFMVKEGDQVTARYRVATISADAVELADLDGGTIRRLVMK
jgi:hypothetical protein